MSDAAELLLELRDIHEPLAPATSSALLLGLAALLGVLLCVAAIGYIIWQRRTLNRVLQQEIHTIKSEHEDSVVYRLAVLLRRVMHHLHGDAINNLSGKQWLSALDSSFRTRYFSEGRGSVFGQSLYTSTNNIDTDSQQLCDDLNKLIGRTRLAPRK